MEIKLEKNKKILVIIDTNRLGRYSKGKLCCKNFSFLEADKNLHQNIVNNFNYAKNTQIDIAIPEIVLEEIKTHQIICFSEELKKLQSLFNKFNKISKFNLEIPEINYSEYLSDKAKSYTGVYNIIKIDTPKEEILKKLIKRVFERKKPFYKKNNESDSGFKDALIWESIIEFININCYDKYFFLTDDSDFESKDLQEEFYKTTKGKSLEVIKEISELKGKLEEEIKGTDKINKALETIKPILGDILTKLFNENFVEIGMEEGVFKITDLLSHEILDINLKKDEYELKVLLTLEHETLYTGYSQIDEIYEHYKDEISSVELHVALNENYNIKKVHSENLLFNNKESEFSWE